MNKTCQAKRPKEYIHCKMPSQVCKQICDELSLQPPGALYVHVPFCLRKCRYCDFYSLPRDPAAAGDYVEAALAELAWHSLSSCVRTGWGPVPLRTPLASIYLGGGTPTAIGPALLRRLLEAIRPLADEATEFTVEANPGTVDGAVAAALAECGVNRVALGVQSFHPAELETLGRIHSPADVAAAAGTLRSAGIANLGLDLIYGIPGQTMGTWLNSLASALELVPEHISAYGLSFEDGTLLGEDLRRGRAQAMDEGLQKECYYAAIETLERAGLAQYEISNFSRPGRRCLHNLTYWHNLPYLGIGPAAASYVGGVRRTNAPDLRAYVRAVRAGAPPPASGERLAPLMAMAETMMLGLRLAEGIDRWEFARRFGKDPLDVFPRSLARHRELCTILVNDTHIRIARDALFVSDTILADIIEEAREN